MIRNVSTCVVLFVVTLVYGQQPVKTETFTINGNIKSPQRVSLTDILKLKTYNLGDIAITNHLGEVKSTAKNLSGVLLRDILQNIALDTDNPKLFSEYYFTCRGSDGYTVVYSWNELFNTFTGNSVYLVTERNGQPIAQSDDCLLMISTQDLRTGRRYVKNLESITVGRAR